jgi:hypothetical protein
LSAFSTPTHPGSGSNNNKKQVNKLSTESPVEGGHGCGGAFYGRNAHKVDDLFVDSITDHYILLHFDSTILIFCNEAKHIRDADVPLCIESSSGDGRQMTYQVSDLDGSGTVWYNFESIAIILSLAEVRRVRRVTMDTSQHKEDGTGTFVFKKHKSVLYLLDASARINLQSDSSAATA